MFGSSLFVCRRTHVLFTLFVFVCVWWCPTHIVLVVGGGVVCLGLVCPLLSVSLDCLFLIAPSVLSNVYIYILFPYLYSYPVAITLECSLNAGTSLTEWMDFTSNLEKNSTLH